MTGRLPALLLTLALAAPAVPAVPAGAQDTPESATELPAITALGAVVYDPAGRRVLWGKKEDVGVPMASTTKIMTTLLAIEAGTLDDTLTVSRKAAQMGGAGLGLKLDQRIPMRSVLAGLMLRSGNDAATAVAEHVAGSEEAFVARMNQRAQELGLRDTRFVNASGLTDDRSHRASPLDLARLTAVAMAHPDFAKWAAARRLAVPGLGTLENRNELIGRYRGANGVKTGYLAHAGLALVASAARGGLTVYVVVLGSRDSFGDATALFDWAFAQYRIAQPVTAGDTVGTYRWADAHTPLVATATMAAAVRRDADVRWRVRMPASAARPVPAGASLGEVELVEDGKLLTSRALEAGQAVPAPTEPGAAPSSARAGAALQEALRAFARLSPEGAGA